MRAIVAEASERDPAAGRDGGQLLRVHACRHAGDAPAILDEALDQAELARRGRMRRADDRAAFTIARALAKLALAEASAGDPRRVRLPLSAGKPVTEGCGPWRFSLSRTRGLVAVTVCAAGDVGVDVERVDPAIAYQELSLRHFAAAEARAIAPLPSSAGREAFFRLWTCKEALGKATGGGIASTVDVDLSRVLRDGRVRARGWTIASFACCPDALGAVAAMEGMAIDHRDRTVDELVRAWSRSAGGDRLSSR